VTAALELRFAWLLFFWALVAICGDYHALTTDAVRVLRIVLATLMLVAIVWR